MKTLIVNGEERSVGDSVSLLQLIEEMKLSDRRIAVELNDDVISRRKWKEMVLTDRDRLEIVHFVGGG